MAVTVEGTPTSTYDFNVSSLTWSHTAGGNGLFVGGGSSSGAVAFSSCTFNGVALTELWDQNDTAAGSCRACGYLMCSPAAGAHNVVLTAASSCAVLWGGAVGLSGLASPVSSAHRTVYSNGAGGAGGPTVTVVDSQSGDLVIDCAASYTTSINVGTGQTSRVEDDGPGGTGVSYGISTESATGANTVMSWAGDAYWVTGATALVASGGTPISGTLSATLAAATLAATGGVGFHGTLDQTLASLAISADGDVLIAGSATQTLAACTIVASGTVDLVLFPDATQLTWTWTGSDQTFWRVKWGTQSGVYPNSYDISNPDARSVLLTDFLTTSGEYYAVIVACNASGEGTASNEVWFEFLAQDFGILAATLGALTAAATGVLPIEGSSTPTLGALTATASGVVAIVGALDQTLAALTCVATTSAPIAGALDVTLSTLVGERTGAVKVVGTSTTSLAALTVVATGTVAAGTAIQGTLSVTLEGLLYNATGTVGLTTKVTPHIVFRRRRHG